MEPHNITLFLLSFLCATSSIEGANILVYIGVGSYSHRIPLQPLMEELVEKGHNVTILSPHFPKAPNPKIHELVPKNLVKWKDSWEKGVDFATVRKSFLFHLGFFISPVFGASACETLYQDEEFTAWFKDPRTKIDMVIVDSLCNECAYGFAHYFKAKLVAFNTGQVYPWDLESRYGLPDETSSMPDVLLHLPVKMNFFQRALNVVMPLVWKAYKELWYFPRLEAITKAGQELSEAPNFKELENNISLYLVNTHWAPEHSRSLPPNVIPVGGITYARGHQAKPLPKHITEFIERGNDGFIFLSFGTVVEFTLFDPKVRQEFVNVLRNFPTIQFIWKSTHPLEEDLPGNVLVEKWLPQMDVLSHPKIRLFITHGGLGGVYEAIYGKVPMICFPIFAEQEYNADLMVYKGYAIKLELTTVTEAVLTAAVAKILNNPRYKQQVEKLSSLFTDRPMNALDMSMWWLEFVLRHDDINSFLKPISANQSWWVRRQLDVWAFLTVIVLLIVYCTVLVFRVFLKLVLRRWRKRPQHNMKTKSTALKME